MEIDPPHAPSAQPASNLPQPTELPEGAHIILYVNGRKLLERKTTLQTSPHFENMLSGRWNVDLLPDGSLPIDSDEDIFLILLGYMRRPTAFPLLWTREKGFDYVTYNKLLAEADFYGLSDLKAWIKERKFLAAVKTTHKIEMHSARFNLSLKARTPNSCTTNHAAPYQRSRYHSRTRSSFKPSKSAYRVQAATSALKADRTTPRGTVKGCVYRRNGVR
jgi:hypothetical protein